MFFSELSLCSSALTLLRTNFPYDFAEGSYPLCLTSPSVQQEVAGPRLPLAVCLSISLRFNSMVRRGLSYSPFQHFPAVQGTDSRDHQLPSPRSQGERSETPCKEISRCLFPCPIIHPHYVSARAPWLQIQCPQPVVCTAAFASLLPLDHAFS